VIFREVATAYEVLGNADQRNEYDSRRSRRGTTNSGRGTNSVFYVGHVDRVVYMKPFSTVIL
jgi:DnaJ-class molecular chaperone